MHNGLQLSRFCGGHALAMSTVVLATQSCSAGVLSAGCYEGSCCINTFGEQDLDVGDRKARLGAWDGTVQARKVFR